MKYSLIFKNNANRVVERFQNPMAEKKIVGRNFSALWLAVFLERGIRTWGLLGCHHLVQAAVPLCL